MGTARLLMMIVHVTDRIVMYQQLFLHFVLLAFRFGFVSRVLSGTVWLVVNGDCRLLSRCLALTNGF